MRIALGQANEQIGLFFIRQVRDDAPDSVGGGRDVDGRIAASFGRRRRQIRIDPEESRETFEGACHRTNPRQGLHRRGFDGAVLHRHQP
jgi:hypothetical protein